MTVQVLLFISGCILATYSYMTYCKHDRQDNKRDIQRQYALSRKSTDGRIDNVSAFAMQFPLQNTIQPPQ